MTEAVDWKPGQFAAWVDAAERHELLSVLCGLTEADRRRFSKEVSSAYRKVHDGIEGSMNLRLAVVAICPWTDVKRANSRFFSWSDSPECDSTADVIRILRERRPEWIDKFIAQELDKEWPRWSVVRGLVRDGVCERPSADNYIINMVRSSAGAGWYQQRRPLLQRIKEDPTLLEHEIWRIFEVDTVRGQLFPGAGSTWQDEHGSAWGPALIALAREGALDRRRLLHAAHETLRRGLQLRDTPFYVRLIKELEPGPEERAALREAYLDLLSHRTDAVARFALEQCAVLLKDGSLESHALISRIAPMLQRETKAPAEAALTLLARMVKKDASLSIEAARVAVDALRHPSADVHEKALDFIATLGAPAELAGLVEDVAPSQRARAAGLVAAEGAGDHQDGTVALEALLARARALDPSLRALYAVDPLLAAIASAGTPPRYVPLATIPRLDASCAVEPVRDFTEMVDLMLAIMETQSTAVDLERALDAFSRLAVEPPSDYRARTAALLQRTTQHATGVSDWSVVGTQLMRLVQLWLQGGSSHRSREHSPETFLELRIDEIVHRVRNRRAAPILALPTHGAWIDPRVLVERARAYQQAQMAIGRRDLLQALLRLAPEHRAEALGEANDLEREEGAVIRHALGATEEPRSKGVLSRLIGGLGGTRGAWPLWAAAARARDPFGSDESLRDTPAAGYHYGAGAVSYSWTIRINKQQYVRANDYVVEIATSLEPRKDPEWPLSLFFERSERWTLGSVADVRYRQAIWPSDPTPVFIKGIHSIVDRMFRPAASFTPTAAYLEPLLDPNVRMSPLAELTLALALVAQDADARTMAVDAAITAIAGGRLLGDELGVIYSRLLPVEGFLKLGRVADAVNAIAPSSRLHQLACAHLLEELLAAINPPGPRDLHSILSSYREILAATTRAADPRLSALIASASGTSKTSKLLKEIAAATGSRTTPADAYRSVLRHRLELANPRPQIP
ncbi:MAG: hypothetical protein HYU52_14050 [Acidobacteria bacterium]|nr:hypothetical protein [Acidobacteriota bacterium]